MLIVHDMDFWLINDHSRNRGSAGASPSRWQSICDHRVDLYPTHVERVGLATSATTDMTSILTNTRAKELLKNV